MTGDNTYIAIIDFELLWNHSTTLDKYELFSYIFSFVYTISQMGSIFNL